MRACNSLKEFKIYQIFNIVSQNNEKYSLFLNTYGLLENNPRFSSSKKVKIEYGKN